MPKAKKNSKEEEAHPKSGMESLIEQSGKVSDLAGFSKLCFEVRKRLETRREEKDSVQRAILLVDRELENLDQDAQTRVKKTREGFEARVTRLTRTRERIDKDIEALPATEGTGQKKGRKKNPRVQKLETERKQVLIELETCKAEMQNEQFGIRDLHPQRVALRERKAKLARFLKDLEEAVSESHKIVRRYEEVAEHLSAKREAFEESLRGESRARKGKGSHELDRAIEETHERLRASLKSLGNELLSSLGGDVPTVRTIKSDFCPKCSSERLRMLSTGGALECLKCGHWQAHLDAAIPSGGSFFFATTGIFGSGAGNNTCGADSSSCTDEKASEDKSVGLSRTRTKKGGQVLERLFALANMETRLSKESMNKALDLVLEDCLDKGLASEDLTFRDISTILKKKKQETLSKHAVQVACELTGKTVVPLTQAEVDRAAKINETIQEQREALKQKKERHNVAWTSLVNVQQLYLIGRPDLICFMDPPKTAAKLGPVEEELKVCCERAFGTNYIPVRQIVRSVQLDRPPKRSGLLDYGSLPVWPDPEPASSSKAKRARAQEPKEPRAKKSRKEPESEEEEEEDFIFE